jgi:hypothetical protein
MDIVSLRCRFRAGCRRGCGRQFAVGPDRAVCEILLFPDGHGALEGVDSEAAGIEGRGTMRRADGDENAGFADFEAAQTVGDGDAVDAVFLVELGADFLHLGEGHGFVGFVVEIEGRAIVRLIADETVEGNDRAVHGSAYLLGQRGHIDGLAHQLVDVIVRESGHADASAAAHGREKGDFVAGAERRIPGGELLIARSDHRGAVFCKIRNPRRVDSEELLNRHCVCELDGIFGMAGEFLKAAEKQDFHANRL